jgi:hypothetical protein
MGVRRLEPTGGKGCGGEVGQQLLAQLVDLNLDFVFVDAGVGKGSFKEKTSRKWKSVLLIFEFISQFQTFYFNFSFPFVFEDGLVRFSVLWGCRVPCRLVIVAFVDAETRKIADNITTRATGLRVQMKKLLEKAGKRTNLPRGVVRPIPLYMVVAVRKGSWER